MLRREALIDGGEILGLGAIYEVEAGGDEQGGCDRPEEFLAAPGGADARATACAGTLRGSASGYGHDLPLRSEPRA